MAEFKLDLSELRSEYQSPKEPIALCASPAEHFYDWFQIAQAVNTPDVNAAVLSSVNSQQQPRGRIVLIKGFSSEGFTFYCNYTSAKMKELGLNPQASLLFWWPSLVRQVRVEGVVQKISAAQSDLYFSSRPRDYQIATWTSPQSCEIKDIQVLENNFHEYEHKYANQIVPRPLFWGGCMLTPRYFEFWQGRAHRLHERVGYRLTDQNEWESFYLAP